MSFHESIRNRFLAQLSTSDKSAILGNTTSYAVDLRTAVVATGQPYWRVVGVHHLTPDENRGKHAIYVDVVDGAGQQVRDPNLRLAWGWEGQRADERATPKSFDKQDSEPATNLDIFSGQRIWVRVEGDGLPSDTVLNLHANHPDESGPQGQLWNSIGHHSFYILFQRIVQQTEAHDNPQKPVEVDKPASGVGPSLPTGGSVLVREKLGIDANQPINPSNGAIEAQVINPKIIAETGVGWVRLNFVIGPWRNPLDSTRYAGHTWQEAYRTIIDGLRSQGLRIYGLISDQAVSSELKGELRERPTNGDAASAWIDTYAATFVEIVRLFHHDIAIFESFNEPDDWKKDNKPGWGDATKNWVHPGWFAVMLQRVRQALGAEPDLTNTHLVSGPLQGLDINNNAGAHYLAQTYRFGEAFYSWSETGYPFDGIGYHLYVAQEGPDDKIQADTQRYLDQVRQVIRDAEKQDRPIYISEIGWESRRVRDENQLAAYMKTGLSQILDDPSVALGIWFCTQDFDKQYGVYRSGPLNTANRKTTFAQLRALAEEKRRVAAAGKGFEAVTVTLPTIPPTSPPVAPPVQSPPMIAKPVDMPPVVQGNKLGFYLHISTNQDGLYAAIQQVQPPVILFHADTANRSLLSEIRGFRSPNSFVIGRMYKDGNTQRAMLDNDNPEAHGRAMADEILNHDFGMAAQRDENGRLLIDAWMSLNEAVPGPASSQYREQPKETARLLANYDLFQVAFRRRLQEAGVEAVAFNFGAGNFVRPIDYLEHFPKTLGEYVYLGFHEYGWPTLYPAEGTASSAATYRVCMEGIRKIHGTRHRVVMTEAGLTRMYKNPAWGDKGWLNGDQPLSEEEYWHSLAWYNGQMLQDDYVLGACLYEVGHHGDWATFRHLGRDNQGQSLHLADRMAALREAASSSSRSVAARRGIVESTPPAKLESDITLLGIVTRDGMPVAGAAARLTGGDDTLGSHSGAALDAPNYVVWTRKVSGIEGNLRTVWQRHVTQHTAGITWPEFKREVVRRNPHLVDGVFESQTTYWLPQNGPVAGDIVWDRPLTGVDANFWQVWQQYVQNKVVGLNYEAFKILAPRHNPSLAEEERFKAESYYNLPRNADHKSYTLTAWSNSRGRFSFTDLPPGNYQLRVTAPDGQEELLPLSLAADTEFSVVLPAVEPAQPTTRGSLRRGAEASHDFVRTAGTEFVERGRRFRFIGVNVRGLLHYGDASVLPHSREEHKAEQLGKAYEMGARVVRVFLPSIHASLEQTIERMRGVVQLVRERFPGLYLLPTFANLYGDVPFRIPGDESFYAKLDPNFSTDLLNAAFFITGYRNRFLPFVRAVVTAFRDEPAILAWEVGNELKLDPAGSVDGSDPHLNAFLSFMQTTAREIRIIDRRHLITTGMISTRHASLNNQGLQRRLYGGNDFDFLTIHCYNQEYHEDDSGLARLLGKPYIVEEAGFGNRFGSDRSDWVRQDVERWFNAGDGARGYMQWGFMCTQQDMGDGDGDSGMDRSLHRDWDALFDIYQGRATQLNHDRPSITLPPLDVDPPPSADFAPGATVYAQTFVNVRRSAGYQAKAPDDVLGQLGLGASATITGSRRSVDGLTWWPIRAILTDGRDVNGFAAESVEGQLLLSRTTPALPRGAVSPGAVSVTPLG